MLTISRSQMSQQISNPKGKKMTKKIKGVDGKACWKGYRYAGTKNGKDKCVKIKGMNLGGEANNNYKKRVVRRMLKGGEAIANGCGKVMPNRRKRTSGAVSQS